MKFSRGDRVLIGGHKCTVIEQTEKLVYFIYDITSLDIFESMIRCNSCRPELVVKL